MKTSRLVAVIALSAIALSVATTRFAFALRGKLSSPNAALSANYPAREKVVAALQRKDCKFLGGSFVNSTSYLRYAGDAGSLNGFIGDLVQCPGVTATVGFKKLDDKCDWLVTHDGRAESFQIQVNLNAKRIDLEKLILPAIKGPKL